MRPIRAAKSRLGLRLKRMLGGPTYRALVRRPKHRPSSGVPAHRPVVGDLFRGASLNGADLFGQHDSFGSVCGAQDGHRGGNMRFHGRG